MTTITDSEDMKELSSPLTEQLKLERGFLDDRLATIRHEVLTCHNELTLINTKLPPEILSNVFHYTKNACRCFRMESIWWIRCITHVCHRWRSIALSNPTLWTEGFPANVGAIQVFLDRSKNLPIVIDRGLTFNMSSRPQFQSLILSHVGRSKELCLDIRNTHLEVPTILKALGMDMPHLEVLDLNFYTSWPQPTTTPFGSCVPIPKPENLRQVRILKLRGCCFDWDRIKACNLTTLFLSGEFPPDLRPSTEQILGILKLSPGLQYLELVGLVHDMIRGSTALSVDVDFSLPQLRHLQLTKTGLLIIKALINPLVLRNLECIILETSTNDKQIVADVLLSAAKLLREKSVSIIQTRSYDLSEKRFFSYSHDPDWKNGRPFKFSFLNSWERSDNIDINIPQIVLSCTGLFDLKELVKLECSLNYPTSEQWWRDILNRTPALQSLRVGCPDLGSLVSALSPSDALGTALRKGKAAADDERTRVDHVADVSSRNRSTLLLPYLFQLTLLHEPTLASRRRSSSVDRRSQTSQFLKDLARCMKLRERHQASLATLAVPCTSRQYKRSGACLDQYVDELMCLDDDCFTECSGSDGFPDVTSYLFSDANHSESNHSSSSTADND